MKTRFLLFLLLSIFTTGLFAQAKKATTPNPEEAAIKKVIEDETHWFNQRNFEKWAECVAHDDMTYYSWTTPFSDENAVFEAKGWDEVSKQFKAFMAKWPAQNENAEKKDYKFKVNGNMAYVTFKEGGQDVEEVRVMEKVNGQWKVLRMEALHSKAFSNFRQLHALQRMAGDWDMDMSSLELRKGEPGWRLYAVHSTVEPTAAGIKMCSKWELTNKEGEYRTFQDEDIYVVHMSTGMIGTFSTRIFPLSGWSEAYMGTGKFNEDGALVLEMTQPGEKGRSTGKIHHHSDGYLVMDWQSYNEKGELVWDSTHKLKRTGVELASKP